MNFSGLLYDSGSEEPQCGNNHRGEAAAYWFYYVGGAILLLHCYSVHQYHITCSFARLFVAHCMLECFFYNEYVSPLPENADATTYECSYKMYCSGAFRFLKTRIRYVNMRLSLEKETGPH